MFVMAAMGVLCMGGIAFCLRFLVALFQERKPRGLAIGCARNSVLAKTRMPGRSNSSSP